MNPQTAPPNRDQVFKHGSVWGKFTFPSTLSFRHMVHLLELAVTFIEKLEAHLETIRNIPNLNANLMEMVSITNIAALNSYTRISTVSLSQLIFWFLFYFFLVSCS